MKKIIALIFLLLIVAMGCTRKVLETPTKEIPTKEVIKEEKPIEKTELSEDISGLEEEELDLEELEDLDLEINESLLE